MPADPSRTASPPQTIPARIEYLDHSDGGDCREYRLAVRTADGSTEVRFRIATAAFGANRVLLQDGPDVCYQRLMRMLAEGEALPPDVLTIGDDALAAYRDAHARAPRRVATSPSTPKPPAARRSYFQETRPKLPIAAPSAPAEAPPSFDEGQRVSHAVFGVGVTMASEGGHTSVQFDAHGTRTFVTSLLKLEALSAPHTWETGPRGKNRPRDPGPRQR